MDQSNLQQLVEELSLEFFGRPFDHQATFNSRLRTTGGRYHLATHHLDFNLKILETFGKAEFISVIKHELCHYHLHLTGRGYQHKDSDFKELLKQTGGTRFVPSLRKKDKVKKIWTYRCESCKKNICRYRRFNTQRFVCGECHGKLVLKS